MDEFLKDIDAFLSETGMTASAFGEAFAKDRSFVFRIRGGKDCGMRKADEVRALMFDHSSSQDTAA